MTANLIVSAVLQRMEQERGCEIPNHVLAIPVADQRKLLRANKRMHKAIKEFEREVWFKGLQVYVRKARQKGHSATSYGLKAMLHAIAGGVMITLEDEKEGVSVTLITNETEASPVMGLQGVGGRVFDAIRLIKEAQRHFQHGRLQFAPFAPDS